MTTGVKFPKIGLRFSSPYSLNSYSYMESYNLIKTVKKKQKKNKQTNKNKV